MSTKLIPRIWPHKIMDKYEFVNWVVKNNIGFYYKGYGYFTVVSMVLGGYFQVIDKRLYIANTKENFTSIKKLSETVVIRPGTEEWAENSEFFTLQNKSWRW